MNTIHVVGAGGVGYWLAVALARDLSKDFSLTVWDNDTVEGTGALRLPKASPDNTKVESLGGFVHYCMGNEMPELNFRRLTPEEVNLHVKARDVVVDCTDSPTDERQELWAAIEVQEAHPIRVSYDGDDSVVVVSSDLPIALGRVRSGGNYRRIPSLALSFVAGGLGAEVVRHLIGNDVEVFPDIFRIRISVVDQLIEWGEKAHGN